MKIVFIASIAGKKDLGDSYRLISDLCKKLGHKVFDDYVLEQSPEILAKTSINTHKENYKKIVAEIKNSDALVAESTQSSLGVGRFISIGLQYHKPIIVLYSRYYPRTLVLDPTRLIRLKKYSVDDKKDLESKLINFFKTVAQKKYSYRFNIMLSDEINNYLLFQSKENKISKADYIRQLISDDIDAYSSRK